MAKRKVSETGSNKMRKRKETRPVLSLHRCIVCGTRWLLWPDEGQGPIWNLLDGQQRPGSCCDNAAMGDQIEHLRDIPLTLSAPVSEADQPQEELVAAFRREVQDKLGVVFNGCNGSPLQRSISRQQCEDFLVEMFSSALSASRTSEPKPAPARSGETCCHGVAATRPVDRFLSCP